MITKSVDSTVLFTGRGDSGKVGLDYLISRASLFICKIISVGNDREEVISYRNGLSKD